MKTIFLISLLAIVLHTDASTYTIHINITGLASSCAITLKDFESNTAINNGVLVNGKGELTGTLPAEPRLLFLTVYDGRNSYWCNFMIGNDDVYLNAAIHQFPFKVKITGSATQDLFYQLNAALADDRIKREELLSKGKSIMSDASQLAELKQLVMEMAVIDSMEVSIKKKFISNHLQSHPAVMELFLLKSTYDKTEFAAYYFQLTPALKESVYGVKIKNYLGIAKIIDKGDKAYPFTAADKNGTAYSFPQLNGKYILLDFTKDHCLPCVQSVNELKEVSKNVNVISFSPDDKKPYDWPLLGDGKGGAGPVIMNYGVEAYPTFVLINPSGIVIAKWSGYSSGSIKKILQEQIK